jgi:BirA family biotin operon repressor/biotin-[acetyl-CoA-carboxylase] ligase
MVTRVPADRASTRPTEASGFAIRWVSETASTNADLLELAAADAEADRIVVVADHQTAGRGRQGRAWVSPSGSSLLMSVLVRTGVDADHLHLVTAATGVAAAEAVEELFGVRVGLKWPNDLMLLVDGPAPGERKLGGILAEVTWHGHQPDAVVIGLGLNLRADDAMPADIRQIATALDAVTGEPPDREALVVALLARLDTRLGLLADPDGREALRTVWRRWSATLGRAVEVDLVGGDRLTGEATDLTPAGELVVTDEAGDHHVVRVGDVVHARPGDRGV